MSKISLDKYFEMQRPEERDILIIVRGVLKAVYNEHKNIYMDTENIYYDTKKKKIYLTEKMSNNMIEENHVNMFMEMISVQCRYAGEGTYSHMLAVRRLTGVGEIEKCIGYLDDAIRKTGEADVERKTRFYFVCTLAAALSELIYLIIMGI